MMSERWRGRGGYKELLTLAIPLILSTGSFAVQEFVDRVFLTWYSPAAIAAATPAGILSFSIMAFFFGTSSYVGTFVAQYYGAGRHDRIGPAVWQGFYFALIGGACMACLAPLAEPIFNLIGHEPAVRANEVSYFRILCLGSAPAIGFSALGGFFSGRGRPWPIMWFHVAGTCVNVVLNYVLIFGHWGFPEMGIRGAALATVASGAVAFTLFAVTILSPRFEEAFHTHSGWRPEAELFRRLLRFGLPIGIQFSLEMISVTIFVLMVGRLGTVNLAATNIALNVNMLAFMPMIGASIAITVLVGQYLGADRPDLAQNSVYSGLHLTSIYMISVAALYVLVPELFIAPFAAQAEPGQFDDIFRLSVVLLRFVALYSVFDVLNLVFSSAIKGAGDTRFVMYAMGLAALLVMALPIYVFVEVLGFGVMSAWVIFTVDVCVLGLIFYFRFQGGKWKSMRVIEPAAAKA